MTPIDRNLLPRKLETIDIRKAKPLIIRPGLPEASGRCARPDGSNRFDVRGQAMAASHRQNGGQISHVPARLRNLDCLRAELKTDVLNQRSGNAILRIGAREEGTPRQHMITWSGRLRDTVYFSILQSEGPGVKTRLEWRLDASDRGL
jgi:hypothetical protein